MTPSSLLGSSARRARGSPVNSLVVPKDQGVCPGVTGARRHVGCDRGAHERATHISRGFTGRRRETGDPARIPPGQYLTRDFPVLSAGPTPHTPLDQWTFTIDGAVDAARTWTWKEFLALPQETPTVDIHCVTKWSKLDTSWRGVSVDTLLRRRRHGGRVRHRLVRRRLHDQPRARGRHRGQGLGRPRVRRRAAGPRARRPGAAPGPASVLLEEREVGARPRADAR